MRSPKAFEINNDQPSSYIFYLFICLPLTACPHALADNSVISSSTLLTFYPEESWSLAYIIENHVKSLGGEELWLQFVIETRKESECFNE